MSELLSSKGNSFQPDYATVQFGRLKGKPLFPIQKQGIEFTNNSDKRFVCIRAETGTGKSILAIHALRPPLAYLCLTINLQEQLTRDLPDATLLKGRRNYPCPSGQFETAEECIHPVCNHSCPYHITRNKFIQNPYGILNFHYYLNAAHFTSIMDFKGSKKSQIKRNIILDEADMLDQVLINFIAFEFGFNKLRAMGLMKHVPDRKTKIDSVSLWLKDVDDRTSKTLLKLEKQVEEIIDKIARAKERGQRYELSGTENVIIKRYKFISNLSWKTEFLNKQDLKDNWVYYSDENRITLKPKWLTREMTDRFLFDHGKKFLFMSATLPSKAIFCGLMGLETDEVDYLDLPPVFTNEKRKIIYTPAYNATYKESKNNKKELRAKVRNKVFDILKQQPGRGLIHSTSYEMAGYLTDLSPRLIFHNSINKKERFDRFINTSGAVFVSPAATRGIDLPDSLCEWIMILKCPWASLGDKQVNARVYSSGKFGRLWYASLTSQTIVQMAGRGYRHNLDYCTIYLTDEQIGRLLQKESSLWPLWFRELVDYDW
jgi:Rad3-related DNA helicase